MSTLHKLWHDESGYTLVELISLTAIIGVLTALMVANTSFGNKRQELRNTAQLYATAARSAESMASSSQPVQEGATVTKSPRKAYGICITKVAATTPCELPSAGDQKAFAVYGRALTDGPTASGAYVAPSATAGASRPDIVRSYTLPDKITFETASWQTYIDYIPPGPTIRAVAPVGPDCNLAAGCAVYLKVSSKTAVCTDSPDPDCSTVRIRGQSGAVYVD